MRVTHERASVLTGDATPSSAQAAAKAAKAAEAAAAAAAAAAEAAAAAAAEGGVITSEPCALRGSVRSLGASVRYHP